MDSKIFGNLNTYFSLYAALARCPLSKASLVKALKESGKSQSTASEQGGNALKGNYAFITGEGDTAILDRDALSEFLTQVCGELNLDAQIQPRKKKQDGDEYITGSVTSAHSQNFADMNKKVNTANAKLKELKAVVKEQEDRIKELEEEQQKKVTVGITENMDEKILVISSVTSDPPEVLAKDFFLDNPVKELDPAVYLSKKGGLLDSIYRPVGKLVPEITEENYWEKLCQRFKSGKLFQKRLEDQNGLAGGRKKKGKSLDANRLASINMLLKDDSLDNQTKLSTYAFWYFHDDPEMEDLLDFAGEYGINANYVIQLLEKPMEYRNYRTMRAFLKQVQMSSEAHIKREAAQELLCGEWKVIADYCGEPCEFRMVPVAELETFQKCLEESKVSEALTSVEKLLESTSGPMDQKLQENVEAPDFVHPSAADADEHAPVDDTAVMDDFAEKELKDEK